MLMSRTAGVWLIPLALTSALIFVMASLPTPADAQTRKVVRSGSAKYLAKRAPRRRAVPSTVAVNPNVTGRDAMLLIDAQSGRELEAQAADELRHPASLTKIMTLYLTFAALDSGQLRLSDRLPVSVRAGSVQPSKMSAPVGGTLMVRDAIMGLITRSANDAAVVLAEAIAGDEASFAQLMTQKARQLGMTSTVFRNASGLPATWQVTTARDLARLAQAMLRDFPHYYPLFSMTSWPYGRHVLRNHNRMLTSYAGADGIKTGYINASGFNLVMSAMRNGWRLIGVVMGGNSVGERDATMADMMDRGFERARALDLPAWQQPAPPPGTHYTAMNFTPGAPPAEPQRQVARNFSGPAPGGQTAGRTLPDLVADVMASSRPASMPVLATTRASTAEGSHASDAPGGWAMQLGDTFSSRSAASSALRTALSRLPDLRNEARPSVETVKGRGGKPAYRARLVSLDEAEATRGCRSLRAARLFFCTPVAIEARAD